MTVVSLHKIVMNMLLKRGYSVHYYLPFLVYAKEILREISFDDGIQTSRMVIIPLDDNNFGVLPNDYGDFARVFVRQNQYLRPLVEDNTLDIVPNYDSDFVVQPCADVNDASVGGDSAALYGYGWPYWWCNNYNIWGENLGRQFGGVGAGLIDTFRIDKARNQIKVNEELDTTKVVMEYIGDGSDADSATQIDMYAQSAIEEGALWQFYLNNRSYATYDVEAQYGHYVSARKILRARKSDLSLDTFKRAVQRNSIAIKY